MIDEEFDEEEEEEKKYSPFTYVSSIVFLVSFILSGVSFIALILHAFEFPENTCTQNVLWYFTESKWWIAIACWALSYVAVALDQ